MKVQARIISDHEAAHAVVAWVEGFCIKSLTVNPKPGEFPGSSGICYVGKEDAFMTLLGMPEVLTEAKFNMLVAGRVSEELNYPDVSADGWKFDFDRLAALMPLDNTTLEIHQFCKIHPRDTEGLYRKFTKKVSRILRSKKGRRAVRALSDALLNYGTLSGMAVVDLLEKSWGKPLPPKAKPLPDHFSLTENGPRTFQDLLFNVSAYCRAMSEDTARLRGNLSDKEENRLGRIRLYLRFLELEIAAGGKKLRRLGTKRISVKADPPPESRSGGGGECNPET